MEEVISVRATVSPSDNTEQRCMPGFPNGSVFASGRTKVEFEDAYDAFCRCYPDEISIESLTDADKAEYERAIANLFNPAATGNVNAKWREFLLRIIEAMRGYRPPFHVTESREVDIPIAN